MGTGSGSAPSGLARVQCPACGHRGTVGESEKRVMCGDCGNLFNAYENRVVSDGQLGSYTGDNSD